MGVIPNAKAVAHQFQVWTFSTPSRLEGQTVNSASPGVGSDGVCREPEHGCLSAKELKSPSLKSTCVQTEHLFGRFGFRVPSLGDPGAKDRE